MEFYNYKCEVINVHDGDTIKVHMDKGHGDWKQKWMLRLAGINTEEINSTDPVTRAIAFKQKEYLETLVKPGQIIYGKSVKVDKYSNRYACYVYLTADGKGKNLSEMMVEAGMAKKY